MASLPKEGKYRDIVESHLRNRLPQEGLHASFERLIDETAPEERLQPPAYSQTDPRLPNIVLSSDGDSDRKR